jgi:hypothetical protein
MDPADLEKADTPLIFRIRNRGVVVSDGGRYAYYIKRHPADPREAIPRPVHAIPHRKPDPHPLQELKLAQ